MQNHVPLCHDAVARMDQSYLLFGTKKRIAAANEALDQLAATPEFRPAVEIAREMAAAQPKESLRVPLLRESLVRMGAQSAAAAAGNSSFLAGVALAAAGSEASPSLLDRGISMVATASHDSLAQALVNRNAGRAGLQVLDQERPADPTQLAAWASGIPTQNLNSSARQALHKATLEQLASSGAEGPNLLNQLKTDAVLQPGLAELGRPGATPLSVAAAVLAQVPAEKRAQAEKELVASLPPTWQALATHWLGQASSDAEKGAVLRGLAEGAQRQDANALGALRTASSETRLTPALARTALDSIQAQLNQPDFPGFAAWCQQKNLASDQVLDESLDMLEGKLDGAAAQRRASARRSDLMSEWLESKATTEQPGQAAFLRSLAVVAQNQPSEPLDWMLDAEAAHPQDPGQALRACGGRIEKLPAEVAQKVTSAWAPLASTPELADKLRLAGSSHDALRQAALAGLAGNQTALQLGCTAMNYRNDQHVMGKELESFLPSDWRTFTTRLINGAPSDSVKTLIYSYCLGQASQAKPLQPDTYTPILNSLLRSQVPDAQGDSLYLALYDTQDAAGKQRLDNWMQISRKLKLTGDASARGAVRLMSDPKLTAGLVASDTVAQTRDPRSTLELLRWEADCARKAANPKQEAYLSAFVAGCEAAFTDKGKDAAALNALNYWKRQPEPKSLQEAINMVNATAQSFGDTVQSQAALADALPLLKPLCSQPGEEPMLDLLIRTAQRQDFADPTSQSGVLVRAAGYLDNARTTRGEPLAWLGVNLIGSCQEDALSMERDVMQAIKDDAKAQGDKQREEVAGYYLDLESWLPPNETVGMLRAGLNLLTQQKYSLQDAVKNTQWPTSVARMAAYAKWGELVSTSGTPLLRHQGSFLRKLADFPLENVDQRANAMYYAFYNIGTQPAADPMKQLWTMGQTAFQQAGNGTQGLRMARLTCQELQGLAQDTARTLEAEYFGVMDKVLALELPHTTDRYYLAQAFLTLEAQKDPQDISRIGGFLTHAAGYVQESSLPLVVNTLLDGLAASCKGWGDTKVLLPLIENASRTLQSDCSRNKVIQVAQELTQKLANYKENYWLVVSAQGGPRSEIQERNDSVIVGGVRVAKGRSESA